MTPAPPYSSSQEHLRDELEPIRMALLHVLLVQQRIREQAGAGASSDAVAFLTDNAEPHRVPRDADLTAALARGLDFLRARVAATDPTILRWPRVCALHGLDALAARIVLATLAPQFSRGFGRAFVTVCPESASGRIPASFVGDLLAVGDVERWEVLEALAPDSPLVVAGLVTVTSPGDATLASPSGMVAASPVLFDYLSGSPAADRPAALRAFCEVRRPARLLHHFPLDPSEVERLAGLADQIAESPRPLLIASPGLAPLDLAEAVCDRLDTQLVRVTHLATTPGPESIAVYRQIALLARLQGWGVALDLGDRDPHDLARPVRHFLEHCHAPRRMVLARRPFPPELFGESPVPMSLRTAPLDAEQRQWAWLEAGAGELGLRDDAIERLARAFSLSEREIAQIVGRVRSEAVALEVDPARALARVTEEARKRLSDGLEGVADKIATTFSFDDLVVSPEVREQLSEVLRYLVHLEDVQQRYRIVGSNARGRGTTVLLHGPSGTGKTHAAAVLAHEAGRDLYRIDTSRIVDKYIGETEKQLDRVFRLAESSQSIILFDEADSLFARRSSTASSSADRFSNMTVNFLLQRMEAYSGMCVMTTNLLEAIDQAFRRRIPFQIEFPKPSLEERERLWTYFLGLVDVPAIDEDTLYDLVHTCDMSGAHIRNAVLKATVRAVADGEPVQGSHVIEAASQEYASLGGLVRRIS